MKREEKVRFPTKEELECLTDDAVPLAQKQAKKYRVPLKEWMVVDAICEICPELSACDLHKIDNIVESILLERKLL